MANSEEQRSTEGMVDYNKNSAMQQQLVHYHAERLVRLASELRPAQSELSVVDYGCGPGQSAIDAVAPFVRAYRKIHPDEPISICHADLPGNDWNGLFKLTTGSTGYDAPLVRTTAAIGSFYDQMVDLNSVDLATCFMASHWLHHAVELDSPGSVWFADLEGEARVTLSERALEDWTCFLQRRSRELRSGGILLVSCLGAIPDSDEINGIAASGRGVYRAIQHVAQEMVDDGLIAGSVLDQFVFGVWFLSEQEARAPLTSDSELRESFDIEEISVVPAPYNPHDVYADEIDDLETYAGHYVGYIRGFGHSTLMEHLFIPGAKTGEADDVAEEFYRRLDALYRKHPGKYAGENWYLTVVLRKT